ncbi:hypothetical protein [Paraclostridium dentum]|uniref:hypothetical protein n=1 Tax=Paraclostridium dentum TaxID=2662455 RepID=UPI003F3D27DE
MSKSYYEEVLNEYGVPILLEGYENATIYIDTDIPPTTKISYSIDLPTAVNNINNIEIPAIKDRLNKLNNLVSQSNKEYKNVINGTQLCEDTIDGYIDNINIKGKSACNLIQNKRSDLYSTSGNSTHLKREFANGFMKYTTTNETSGYITIRTNSQKLLKPNTKYTFIFEIKTNTISNYKGVTVCGVSDCYYGRDVNRLYHNENFSLSPGIKKITITTGSNVSAYDGLGFGFPKVSDGIADKIFIIGDCMLLEGDVVNNPGFFEGLRGVDVNLKSTNSTSTKEDYKNINIPVEYGLKSLPNGIKDEICKEGNSYRLIQRVGYKILNGTEDYQIHNHSGLNTLLSITVSSFPDLKTLEGSNNIEKTIYCDILPTLSQKDNNHIGEGISVRQDNKPGV